MKSAILSDSVKSLTIYGIAEVYGMIHMCTSVIVVEMPVKAFVGIWHQFIVYISQTLSDRILADVHV